MRLLEMFGHDVTLARYLQKYEHSTNQENGPRNAKCITSTPRSSGFVLKVTVDHLHTYHQKQPHNDSWCCYSHNLKRLTVCAF